MVLPIGKVYTPANAEELRDRLLADYELEARANGIDNPPIAPGTEVFIRFTATANALMLAYSSISKRDAARRVLDADLAELNDIRIELGLPEVSASRSSGAVRIGVSGGGTITVPNGTEGVLDNGFRIKTNGVAVGVAHNATINVVSIDEGEDANAAIGERIRWVNPPLNLQTEATVSTALTGGVDVEDETRMRNRILNRLQNNPQGGNWSQIIEWVLNGDASVQYAFVYPALGGPATFRVCIVNATEVDDDTATYDFTRAPTAGQLATAVASVQAQVPGHTKFDVVAPVEVNADAAVLLDLPAASEGTDGWENDTVWPDLLAADNGRVTVTTVGSTTNITISANTTTAPTDGVSKIMWWSPTDQRFYASTISSHSGTAGAWVLTLGTALTDATGTDVAAGDFISPAAYNRDNYTDSWRSVLALHGPGECTQDSNRLPRAARHPGPRENVASHGNFPTDLTGLELCEFQEGNDEITNLEWSYRAVLGTSDGAAVGISPPDILVTRHFGVYQLT